MGSDRAVGWDQYAAQWRVHDGGYDLRRASWVIRLWLRLGYWLARVLAVVRVGPGAVTVAGVGLAAAVPVLAGRGPTGLLLASGLALLSTFARVVAHALEILCAQAGPRAEIRRAAGDRLGELAWLVGFWTGGAAGPLVVAAGAATALYSQVRELGLAAGLSRAGVQAAGGRPTWAVLAVVGLALAGLGAEVHAPFGAGVLTIAVAVWLLLTLAGLGQLAGVIRRSLP